RTAPLSNGFLFIDPLPTNKQSVAIGEFDRIVVRQALGAVILEIPNEAAIPGEFLNSAGGSGALEALLPVDCLGRPKEVAVFEQVGGRPAGMLARPCVNDMAVVVEQIRLSAARIDEIVTG